jgi:hypothetical protein
VTLLNEPSPSTRKTGLASLKVVVGLVPAETRLLILQEQGMVGVLQKLLDPEGVRQGDYDRETGKDVLDLLVQCIDHEATNTKTLSKAEDACKVVVFESALLPLIIQATAVHSEAYFIIRRLSVFGLSKSIALGSELGKELFNFPGVTDSLVRGMRSNDKLVQQSCLVAMSNITVNHEIDLNEHHDLVSSIIETFTTLGVSLLFTCK